MKKIKDFFKRIIMKIRAFFDGPDEEEISPPPPPPVVTKPIDVRVDEAIKEEEIKDIPGNATVGLDKDGNMVFK